MRDTSNFFANKRKPKAPSPERVAKGWLTEDQLGESIRDACNQLGWHFLWLRKTINSSDGILDLKLIPITHLERRHIIERELKGHDARGRLYEATLAQLETIRLTNLAGGDAGIWVPTDWFSGRILEELC